MLFVINIYIKAYKESQVGDVLTRSPYTLLEM